MKYITLLILIMFSGIASAGTADVAQINDTIYVWGSGDANLSYIENQVSNASALTHVGAVFIAGANIHVNGTGTTLYINDSDCAWLKLNSTSGDVSDFRVDGYFEMNNSKITSWNTTSSAVVDQTNITMHVPRPAIHFGDGDNNVHVNISNSNISYCGYNSSASVWGIYFSRWMNGTIENTTLSYMYSIYVTRSDRNTFNYMSIYNNSYCGIEIENYNDDDTIINSNIYNNGYIAEIDGIYGGGGIRFRGEVSNNFVVDNTSIHDGYGALTLFQSGGGTGTIIKNSRVYNTTTRGIEFNTAPGGIAENNTVYNVPNGFGLYDVYKSSHIFRNNTVHDCLYGIRIYKNPNISISTVYNNTFYNNTYHIYFYNSATTNSTIDNNTIAGAASSYDIYTTEVPTMNTLQDLNNYDDDLTMYLKGVGTSLFINYTTNKIMSNGSSATTSFTNTYFTDHSSMFANATAYPAYATVYFHNGTLTAATTNATILSVNEWNETAGYEAYNITVNSSNATEICTFTANVANATDYYGCYVDGVWSENVQAVAGVASWTYTGGFTEHDLEIRWNSTSVDADSITYIVLQDTPTNQSMIVEWNVTRIGSNVTDWGIWLNHTFSGWTYFFRYTNGTEIMNQTATSNNESLWFNGTSLLPVGVYFINATSDTYQLTLPLGWSIIGWTNPTASTAHSMGTLIGGNCTFVSEYNATTGYYTTHNMLGPEGENNFLTERGWGYWVKTSAETLWECDSC